jgi:hypothetical protein
VQIRWIPVPRIDRFDQFQMLGEATRICSSLLCALCASRSAQPTRVSLSVISPRPVPIRPDAGLALQFVLLLDVLLLARVGATAPAPLHLIIRCSPDGSSSVSSSICSIGRGFSAIVPSGLVVADIGFASLNRQTVKS